MINDYNIAMDTIYRFVKESVFDQYTFDYDEDDSQIRVTSDDGIMRSEVIESVMKAIELQDLEFTFWIESKDNKVILFIEPIYPDFNEQLEEE